MKILVTGSAGFIGQHMIAELLCQKQTVLGIDIRQSPVQQFSDSCAFCDLCDAAQIKALMDKFAPDVVFHLAARTDLDGKDLQSYSANIEGVKNLIAAIRSCPTVKRCIYTSSQLVCEAGYVMRHELDYRPSTLYGQSKVLTEKIVRDANGGGVEWCLVRPTTIWGPGMSAHYQCFFRAIKSGWYFHVGRKPLYKSYGYVGNTVHQYLRLIQASRSKIQGKILYLADYKPISLRAWADSFQQEMKARPIPTLPEGLARMLAVMGDGIQRLGLEKYPFTSFRLNNVLTEYQFDLTNTESICGILPYTMNEGVKRTVAWLTAADILG